MLSIASGNLFSRESKRGSLMIPIGWSSLVLTLLAAAPAAPVVVPPIHWLPVTAYAVPKETAPEGEGYFSIIEGHNGRLYIGTHADGVNAWLVEFDPQG